MLAQASALQSDSSSLGTLINERAVQDLPLNGRNFFRLAQLSMGANEDGDNALQSGNRPDDRRSSTAVAVNGQHGYNNNFMIDGLDDNERYIGTIVVKPAMDALAEFKLITNGYAAELGRTAGGVINLITKSGTEYIPWQPLRVLPQRKDGCQELLRRSRAPLPHLNRTSSAAVSAGQSRRAIPSFSAITKVSGCGKARP